MHTFEITIHRKNEGGWPVVVRHQPGYNELTLWANGVFDLDLDQLNYRFLADKEYGTLLGKNLFRDEVRDAFVRAISGAIENYLRVYLIVEADELRSLHWEQLCAPFEGGRWDYLLLNQKSPFSLYLPSQIERRFPPIGRRDLRALLLVAGPEELETDYKLAPFDIPKTITSIRTALGDVPSEVLASVEGAAGSPTLDTLCERLTVEPYPLLHIICHGAYKKENGETLLFFPRDKHRDRLVTGSELISRLNRLEPAHGLPHFTFLSTCESATPQAENGFGGLGQGMVRDLGMPAVLAMTNRVSILTAQALARAFYSRLVEHGEVDRALVEALAGLQGRFDVTVPALFSRLGGQLLFSDALDRPLNETEIGFGLELLQSLLEQRAPILLSEFEGLAANVKETLGALAAALSPRARNERETALAAINLISNQALDLSFNALALGQNPPDYDDRCPFRGLYPFRVEDREFFFGRQVLVEKMSTQLNNHNFLAILGPSGCGKSSLVLAGLVPELGFSMIYLTPGSDPLIQLETTMARTSLRSDVNYIIVVDQFEELFTLCEDEYQRQAFIDRLLELAHQTYLVLTMRADFWGECAVYPALKEEMQTHQELVAPLKAPELRRVMEQQADHVGLRFDAGLGEVILDDVTGEPGVMPLLQHALLLLWQRRHGRWLRREEYRAIGGIQQAISHTAEIVYEGLSIIERKRTREIFIRLTHLEEDAIKDDVRDTRRRIEISELVPAGSDPAVTISLVKRLADARLIVTNLNPANNQEEVEVAHEALIRHWPRLRTWINDGRDWLRIHEGVRQAAMEWQAYGREDAYLLHRGGRLEDAAALSKAEKITLNELEGAYLEACIELTEREQREKEEQHRRELQAARALAEEQRKRADEKTLTAVRIRRRALIITAVGMVAIGLAIFSGILFSRAKHQANIAYARELAALALSQLDQNPDLALLLSIEAFRLEDLSQTRQTLFKTLVSYPQVPNYLGFGTGIPRSIAWSPDGNFASGFDNGEITIWNLETGRPKLTLEGHSDRINSLTWSPDERLASGSKDNSVIIWNLESGKPENILRGHSSPVLSVAWSKDGSLASGSDDGTVIVWDLDSGKPEVILEGHSNRVRSVAWSSDGRLASGSDDDTVIVWDLDSGEPEVILEGHSNRVRSVAWSSDGRLASGSDDGTVIVWDTDIHRPEMILDRHSSLVNSVAWSSDGRLASGSYDHTIIVWDLQTGLPDVTLEGHSRRITNLAWSSDGELASASDDGTVIVWDLENGIPFVTLEWYPEFIASLAYLQNSLVGLGSNRGSIHILDLKSGDFVASLAGAPGSKLTSMAWSPDGRLAAGLTDGHILVWFISPTTHSIGPIHPLKHTSGITSLAWSPQGGLTSGSQDGTVIIWDLVDEKPEIILEGFSNWITSVAWSPEGRLVSGSDDGTVIVWDLENGKPETILEGFSNWITSVAWSPEGRLVSGSDDGTVIVWDLENGIPFVTLEEHSDSIVNVFWTTDGQLVSSSLDGSIIFWYLESGSPEIVLEGYSGSLTSVAWPEDSGSDSDLTDSLITSWQVEPEVWIDEACQRVSRNLTKAEWAIYFPGETYRKTCEQ